jgi:PAS domain S-box-containing protein
MEWLQERLALEGEVRGHESAWTVDGTAIKVRENIRAMRDGNGKLVFYEGTVEDISEHKNAEESLRAKADFLEEVVTNATVGIFVIDEDNKYVLINPECGRIVGHWPDDWTGREAGLHVHPEDQGKAMAHFIQAISGEQNDFEVRLESSDGTYKHCRINLSPMMLGDVAHVLGVVSDITEKANAEELLTEKRSQNLNIILVAALTQMATRMPQSELEDSMGRFEKWFEQRFEKMFEEDMELISTYETPGEKGMEGPELVVRRYMRFYSSMLKVFGIQTECTFGPTESTLEMLNCEWLPESKQSPVPCRICKTILCGSFEWTGLDSSAKQVGTIARGSSTCKFVFRPGPPRHRKVDRAQ